MTKAKRRETRFPIGPNEKPLNHERLAMLAAEIEIERIRDELSAKEEETGAPAPRLQVMTRDVMVSGRGAPLKIPVIVDLDALQSWKEACAGVARKHHPPKPIPLRDFVAWTYRPRCPRCKHGNPHVSEGSFGEDAPATCTRPRVGSKAIDCGWSGTSGELLRECFGCAEWKPFVLNGECAECGGRKPAPSSRSSKKRSKKKASRKRASKAKKAPDE